MFTPQSEDHRDQCIALWRDAFHLDEHWVERFLKSVPWETVQCLAEEERIAAALAAHEFGQFFGGRRMDCAGLGLVASAAEFRSRGLARRLLTETLREQHRRGVPLSALYPSTRTLYRKVGYETAGGVYRYSMPPHRIDVGRAAADVRSIGEEDHDLVNELYQRYARRLAGLLDRNQFLWDRIRHTREGKPRKGYLFLVDGEPRGYFYYNVKTGDDRRTIEVWDLVALDAAAGRRFLAFMADQRSVVDDIVLWGGPNHPVLMLPGEQRFEVKIAMFWMLRLVHVEQALTQRGYPPGVEAQIDLEVTGDDVIDENNGRYRLHISDGTGSVERGGEGDLKVSIRGLAPLYSGHLAPIELYEAGLVQGPEAAMAAAAAIFAGPQPWLADGF